MKAFPLFYYMEEHVQEKIDYTLKSTQISHLHGEDVICFNQSKIALNRTI